MCGGETNFIIKTRAARHTSRHRDQDTEAEAEAEDGVCKSQQTQEDRADRASANMYRTQARAKQTNGDAMNPESEEG